MPFFRYVYINLYIIRQVISITSTNNQTPSAIQSAATDSIPPPPNTPTHHHIQPIQCNFVQDRHRHHLLQHQELMHLLFYYVTVLKIQWNIIQDMYHILFLKVIPRRTLSPNTSSYYDLTPAHIVTSHLTTGHTIT